jgi:hypothetical protein
MSHKSPLREDKTCLNCNHVVAGRFCPNCGQENADTRKTFYHLFVHFFEDLTHYENAFWKTIKNLLLRPASLSKEYLSGKRLSYLAPVRLYIFISFVTFFILSLFPNVIKEEIIKSETENSKKEIKQKQAAFGFVKVNEADKGFRDSISPQEEKLIKLYQKKEITKKEFDTLLTYTQQSIDKNHPFKFASREYKSVQEMDSLQKIEKEKMHPIKYWIARKLMKSTQNRSSSEILPAFFDSLKRNIPKALFIYMPIFAFLLWLFYSKKRWYYFDHGIFTLHYFSFMLLVILLASLLVKTIYLFGENTITESIETAIDFIIPLWFIFYFYRACKNFYQGSRIISFVKSSFLLFLNTILMFFVLLFFVIYSFLTIH